VRGTYQASVPLVNSRSAEGLARRGGTAERLLEASRRYVVNLTCPSGAAVCGLADAPDDRYMGARGARRGMDA